MVGTVRIFVQTYVLHVRNKPYTTCPLQIFFVNPAKGIGMSTIVCIRCAINDPISLRLLCLFFGTFPVCTQRVVCITSTKKNNSVCTLCICRLYFFLVWVDTFPLVQYATQVTTTLFTYLMYAVCCCCLCSVESPSVYRKGTVWKCNIRIT